MTDTGKFYDRVAIAMINQAWYDLNHSGLKSVRREAREWLLTTGAVWAETLSEADAQAFREKVEAIK